MAIGLLILWLAMATLVAAIASSKGRSWLGFFVYGFLVWPLALIHALVMAPTEADGILSGDARKCPYCAETIKREAIICKHCRHDVVPLPSSDLIA